MIYRKIVSIMMIGKDTDFIVINLECGHAYRVRRGSLRGRQHQFYRCGACEAQRQQTSPTHDDGGVA